MMRPSFTSASSLLAMAAMMAAAPVPTRAQSFNATGTIVAGAGAILTGPGTTTVSADAPNLVINWIPNDAATGGGPIDFQTAGTTASFANRDATSLNVLNRILPQDPSRPIVFNGTVTSQLVDLATGAASRGGTLFFYSPGGILVSSTGVFDVGNLVLTASDLSFDPSLGSFGSAGTYSFLPANAGSLVQVQKGARITAGPINAYVALVAPKVINSGTINVDGSAVLVAADASTITFRPNGLFDIQIDQGTSAAGEVVTNDGTITGPVGSSVAAHRVYMVAVPRNDAITMAIKGGSSLGFDVAGAADVVGNAIVLSAGYGVTNGAIDDTRAKLGGTNPAALTIGAITATSQLTGKATGQASLTVDSGNTASFASDVLLSGVRDAATGSDDGAFISVSGIGSTLDITNNLQLTALDVGQVTGTLATDSGNASVTVDQGKLTVGGSASISSARGPLVPVDAIAGKATLAASGGATIGVTGDLTITAGGFGKSVSDASSSGPNAGTGGTAQILFDGGSTVSIGRDLLLDASGSGGSTTLGGVVGADGTGGTALIQGGLNGGSLIVSGATTLDARGFGGQGLNCGSCTVEGGKGTGGAASIIAAKGSTFTLGNLVSVDASALGGAAGGSDGTNGGTALGGTALVRSDGGLISAAQSLAVRAEGTGGNGANITSLVSGPPTLGGTGGTGTGGSATISAGDVAAIGNGGKIAVVSDVVVSTTGYGGNGGQGGAGFGGTSSVSARNGSVSGATLAVLADGFGGSSYNGGVGGSGEGTIAEVMAYSALEGDSRISFSAASVSARGEGGAGSSPQFVTSFGSAGGDGVGGLVRVFAEAGNGALALGETSLNANGTGGNGGDGLAIGSVPSIGKNGGNGGIGRGGIAQAGVVSGLDTGTINTGSADLAALSISARGAGGIGGAPSATTGTAGNYGSGGAGYGGSAAIFAEGGKVTLSTGAIVDAGGQGGDSGLGGTAGDGVVGDAGGLPEPFGSHFYVASRTGQPSQLGVVVASDLTFLASAATGKGGTSGNATVLGHPLSFLMDGGTISAGNLSFLATGTPTSGAPSSGIALAGGSATLTGDLSFVTPGTLNATLDGADLHAVNVTISAADWLPGLAPAGTPGTVFGSNSVTLTTGNDLYGHFSVNSGGALTLAAQGLVRLDDLTAVGNIGVSASTTVALGAVQSGGTVSINALSDVTVGNVGAGTDAVLSSGGALATGGITAGQTINLDGATSMLVGGPLQAGDMVLLNSFGTIGTGAISAGLVSPSALSSATYKVIARGGGGLNLGNVSAKGNVALLSPNAVSSGAITANEMVVLASGNQSLGGITATGRVLLADFSLASFSGDTLNSFNMPAAFAAAPVASSGVISLSGAATLGQLTALTTGNITTKDVTATAAGLANGTINLNAGGSLGTGAISAQTGIGLSAGTDLTLASASTATGDITLISGAALASGAVTATTGTVLANAGTSAQLGDITASGPTSGAGINVFAGSTITLGNLSAAGGVSVTTSGDVTVGNVGSGDTINLFAGGLLSAGGLTAAQSVFVNGITQLTLSGDVDAGDAVQLISDGQITGKAVSAGITSPSALSTATYGISVLGSGGVALGDLTAARDIVLLTPLDLSTGTMKARDILALAGGSQTIFGFNASGRVLLADYSMVGLGGSPFDGYDPNLVFAASTLTGTGSILVQNASTAASLRAAAKGNLFTSDVTVTGLVDLASGAALRTGGVSAGATLTMNGGGAVSTGLLSGDAGVSVTGLARVDTGAITSSAGAVTVSASNTLTAGAVTAGTFVNLVSSGGGLAAGNVRANAGRATLNARNAASAGNVSASADVRMGAGGNLTLGSATSDTGDVNLFTQANALTGDLAASAGRVLVQASGSAALGNLTAAGLAGGLGLRVTTGTTLSVGNAVVTAGELRLTSGGAMGTGDLTANAGLLNVNSSGSLSTGALAGSAGITLTAAGDTTVSGAATSSAGDVTMNVTGALTTTTVGAGGAISIAADKAITTGTLTAVSTIQLRSTQSTITTSDLTTDGKIFMTAPGNVRLGNVFADVGSIEIGVTNGSLTTGSLSSGAFVALVASGDLDLGAVTAPDIALLAGGSTRAASLAAAGGRILVASNTLGSAGGPIGQFAINPVFAQPLVASGGGLTVTGATTGSTFTASVSGDAATGGIAASTSIFVDAGGTARLSGVWQSPSIRLRANDLDLPVGSGLNAGLSGRITLISRNPAGMRIGDGLDGSVVPTSGFSLDNAEWSRINSGSFSILAPDVAGPVDILIGKLDVTGPDAGSTIDDPQGVVLFSTGGSAANGASGTIRVVGALKAVGFRPSNALAFSTGQFQVAADTGSIAVQGLGGSLAGSLQIDARDIHVAQTSLLGSLAADPFFSGVEPVLDSLSAGSNGPVVSAGAFNFTVGRSLYIERTGYGFDPLGFEVPLGSFNVRSAGSAPIAVIVNGTLLTSTGLVSGAEAWRQFKASDVNLLALTRDSRLNGCLLIAAGCSIRLEPDPGIRPVIEWVDKPKLDDKPIDPDPENPVPQSKDAIVPPQLLLPIRPDALPDQVAEPIAGSGNPALSAGGALVGAQP